MTGNVRELCRAHLGALNAHEFDRMDEFVHEQVSFNGEPVTRDQPIAAPRALVDTVPDFSWHLEDPLVDGVRVAARLTLAGTRYATGSAGLGPERRSVSPSRACTSCATTGSLSCGTSSTSTRCTGPLYDLRHSFLRVP
ncbi:MULTISPECIES: ester cyclase [unclassified Pseudonocardia]|uniref:ester cyclase n=1 Tax=unclassified Pseudonocardia TaxID=2619320 RepID=UPI001CF6CD54|nr:ester cyclase [Pseudonocardia sp. ICBG601]